MNLKIIGGGINSPKGYSSTGSHVGVKKFKMDLAIIYSKTPAKVAAVFTTNKVKAAPVLWNQKVVENKNLVQAIVTNSGNANACTGEKGKIHTEMMAATTALMLNLNPENVIITSTGII